MIKKLMVVVLGLALMVLVGCDIKTPEIHGVVLDAETKQSVPEAWIQFTIVVDTKNIAGGATTILRVEPPHTRTDDKGEFVIPAQRYQFPEGFGSKISGFGLIAETIDDREGGYGIKFRTNRPSRKNLKDFGTEGFDIKDFIGFWGKDRVKITILVKKREDLDDHEIYYLNLRAIYNYCFYGRSFLEVPPVKGGCDEWELNYAIKKHEGFLQRLGEPKNINEGIWFSGTLAQLAYLHKRKGDYQTALKLFKEVKDFDKKRRIDSHLFEYDTQIQELQQLLDGKRK